MNTKLRDDFDQFRLALDDSGLYLDNRKYGKQYYRIIRNNGELPFGNTYYTSTELAIMMDFALRAIGHMDERASKS